MWGTQLETMRAHPYTSKNSTFPKYLLSTNYHACFAIRNHNTLRKHYACVISLLKCGKNPLS